MRVVIHFMRVYICRIYEDKKDLKSVNTETKRRNLGIKIMWSNGVKNFKKKN